MYELSIKSDFSASHMIRNHPGRCKDLHGHTWKVEVVICAQMLDSLGMVIDFKKIKGKLKSFLDRLDHTHLNDLPFFKKTNPTTENIAKFIFNEFAEQCRPFKIKEVTVWESDHTSIKYYKK